MPTFPALDEEPPPRPFWQVLLAVGGPMVAVAVVVVVVLARPWEGPGRGTATAAGTPTETFQVAGRVLELDFASGRLGLAAPDGTGFTPLPGDTLIGGWESVSPGHSAVVTSIGQVVRITGGRTVQVMLRPPGAWTPTALPWTDHGTRVLQMTIGGGHADLRSVNLAGGRPRSLGGNVNDAVGDPVKDGALVMVAGDRTVEVNGSGVLATVRLELRTPGHRDAFAETADLAGRIGLPGEAPYEVHARFSRDGQYVAVTLDGLGVAAHGLAVLNRWGQEVFMTRAQGALWTSWAHDSRRLAFAGHGEQLVHVVDVTHAHAPARFPVGGVDGCLWSPDDTYLACDDYGPGTRHLVEVGSGRTEGPFRLGRGRFALAWEAGAA